MLENNGIKQGVKYSQLLQSVNYEMNYWVNVDLHAEQFSISISQWLKKKTNWKGQILMLASLLIYSIFKALA